MKNPILLMPIALVLSGCLPDYEYPPAGYICKNGSYKCEKEMFAKITCDNERRAEFIIECAKAANPMSDEEGED